MHTALGGVYYINFTMQALEQDYYTIDEGKKQGLFCRCTGIFVREGKNQRFLCFICEKSYTNVDKRLAFV